MRLRFLKAIASVYGSFNVNAVVDIPDETLAKYWIAAGAAEEHKGKETAKARRIIPFKTPKIPKEKPTKISKGQYWCGKCHTLHKETSNIGKKHLKHRVG